jgi:hypothetical protein
MQAFSRLAARFRKKWSALPSGCVCRQGGKLPLLHRLENHRSAAALLRPLDLTFSFSLHRSGQFQTAAPLPDMAEETHPCNSLPGSALFGQSVLQCGFTHHHGIKHGTSAFSFMLLICQRHICLF